MIDSGATIGVVSDARMVSCFVQKPIPFRVADGQVKYADGIGYLTLRIQELEVVTKSIVMLKSAIPILPLYAFKSVGAKVSFDLSHEGPHLATMEVDDKKFLIGEAGEGKLFITTPNVEIVIPQDATDEGESRREDLINEIAAIEVLDTKIDWAAAANTFVMEASNIKLPPTYRSKAVKYHYHNGHPHVEVVRAAGHKVTAEDERAILDCEICARANARASPHTFVVQQTSIRPLHKIWMDTHGPVKDWFGNKYWILAIMDDYSRFVEVRILETLFVNTEITNALNEWKAITGLDIGIIQTDAGNEFAHMYDYQHIVAPARESQFEGRIERIFQTLRRKARKIASHLPLYVQTLFLPFIWKYAATLYNRTPHSALNKDTPYARFHPKGHNGQLDLPQFGANVTISDPKKPGNIKLAIFVGYDIFKSQPMHIAVDKDEKILRTRPAVNFGPTGMTIRPNYILNASNFKYNQRFDRLINIATEIVLQADPEIRGRAESVPERIFSLQIAEVFAGKKQVPKNWEQSQEMDDFRLANEGEVDNFMNQGVFEGVDEIPKDCIPISFLWCWAYRHMTEAKSRLVALGNREPDEASKTSPVGRIQMVRLLLLKAAAGRLTVYAIDIKCAFLNAEMQRDVYGYRPKGFEKYIKTKYVKLKKNVYGLKDASATWYYKLKEVLMTLKVRFNKSDKCTFVYEHGQTRCEGAIHVDDFLLVGDKEAILVLIGRIQEHFVVKVTEKPTQFIGIEIEYRENGIFLHSTKYVEKLLKEARMDEANGNRSPYGGMHDELKKIKPKEQNPRMLDQGEHQRYRTTTGQLNWLTYISRYDIAHTVSLLLTKLDCPTEKEWMLMKLILRYLATTKKFGILYHYGPQYLETFTVYADANYGPTIYYGYMVYHKEHLVDWKATKAKRVHRNTSSAETYAIATAVDLVKWLLFNYLETSKEQANTKVYSDNDSAIKAIKKQEEYNDIMDNHLYQAMESVNEAITEGIIDLEFKAGSLNRADLLTKPFGFTNFGKAIKLTQPELQEMYEKVWKGNGEDDAETKPSLTVEGNVSATELCAVPSANVQDR